MPIFAQFQNKKWFNQYRNGTTFGENLTDRTPNMRANQHEKVLFIGDLINVCPTRDYYSS